MFLPQKTFFTQFSHLHHPLPPPSVGLFFLFSTIPSYIPFASFLFPHDIWFYVENVGGERESRLWVSYPFTIPVSFAKYPVHGDLRGWKLVCWMDGWKGGEGMWKRINNEHDGRGIHDEDCYT